MMKGFSKPNSERQGKTISYRRRSTFLSLFERHIRMQIHFRPGNNFESMLEKKKRKKEEREREKREREREKNVIHRLLHRRRSISKLSPFRNLRAVVVIFHLGKTGTRYNDGSFFSLSLFLFLFFFFPSRFHFVDKEKKRDYSQAHEISRLT